MMKNSVCLLLAAAIALLIPTVAQGEQSDSSPLSNTPLSNLPSPLDYSSNTTLGLPFNTLDSNCQGKACVQLKLNSSGSGRLEPSASVQFTFGGYQSQQNRTQRILAELKVKEFDHRREMEVMERLSKAMTSQNYTQVGLWVQTLARIRGTTPQSILTELHGIQGSLVEVLDFDTVRPSLQEVRSSQEVRSPLPSLSR
jgi:hypothetical protein